jgi:short-subunit dehydrogenase
MNQTFTDKVAVVTGGASGLGKALCELLARCGATVVVTDIDQQGAEHATAAIVKLGGRAQTARLDVTNAGAVEELVHGVAQEHGRLDYMFNNAGIGIAAEVRDIDTACWHCIVDVNLLGVIHGTAAAYNVMVRQGHGHIVNMGSLAGLVGCPTATPYVATKSAVAALSTSLRAEGAGLGVNVSVVCPGFVKTAFYERAKVVKADRDRLFGPIKMMSAETAAAAALKGVARNKAVIIFPFIGRVAWLLYRIHPALVAPFHRKLVRDFRALRDKA